MSEVQHWQSNELERIRGCTRWIWHLAKRRYERHVAKHAPMGEKSTMLLHVSDFSPQRYGWLGANIPVAYPYFPTQRLDESIETAEKCRLARSTLADERNSVAGWDINADVVERDYGAELMRDVPGGERWRHALKTGSTKVQPRVSKTSLILKSRLHLILRLGASPSRPTSQ
jgi:hypothetical protein